MNKNAKKIIAFLAAAAMTVSSFTATVSAAGVSTADVGALADTFTPNTGVSFQLTENSRIFVVADSTPTGDLLQTVQLIQRQIAADNKLEVDVLPIVWGPESWAWNGDIVLHLDASAGIAADGYQLDVTEKAVVTASDVDGLLYGANNLMKHMHFGGKHISGFMLKDEPDTKERTVMLDTGRKYYTVEWICNFIRQISWMGYNALEIHFSEDGGFRADLWDPAYYKGDFQPENDFTWLCGSHVQSWVKDPYRTDPDAGKYLTTAELVQICNVAKEYHIDIIPSFDSPAHMDYICWKFEQNYKSNSSYSFKYNGTTYKASSTKGCINYTGKTGASSPTWPYYTTIDITDGTMAKAFVFALYEDIADFFKEYAGSTKFNIGADEVNLSSSYGPKWSYSQFPGYVNELNKMLNGKGYTVRMFNDFIGSTTYNQNNSKAVYDFDDNIEILYWNSDFNPTTGKWDEPIWHVKFFWENNTGASDNWGDGGRTIYNCIQTNCYYVLRVAASDTSYPNMDARNPKNYNWTFYHSTEENIYNEWYPADISEKGKYVEDAADVPEDQLGGAYFLIWNDYASLNTEAQVWNDVKDNTGTSSYVYSLFDRMYSNIIKMWNSDINSSVEYAEYANILDTYKTNDKKIGYYFPGFANCSKAPSLPDAKTPSQAYLADHTELTAALKDKIENTNSKYTADSYAAYDAAYSSAQLVDANHSATAEEIKAALDALTAAKNALVEDTTALRTELKTLIDAQKSNASKLYTDASYAQYSARFSQALNVYNTAGATAAQLSEQINLLKSADQLLVNRVSNSIVLRLVTTSSELIEERIIELDDSSVSEIYLPRMTGYTFQSVLSSGYKFIPLPHGDGSGHITGTFTNNAIIEICFNDEPDTTYLESLVRTIKAAGYDLTSSLALANALNNAETLIAHADKQKAVNDAVKALQDAVSGMVIENEEEQKIYSVEKLSASSKIGKKVTLIVTTTANIDKLSVSGVAAADLTLAANIQTLKDGSTVKVWIVRFTAPAVDTEYTITAGTATQDVMISVY